MAIVGEQVQELYASGKRLRTVELTTYTGEQVRSLYPDLESLRGRWAATETRAEIIAALEERGIALDHLAAVAAQPEADPFDLLCHVAFAAPLQTRRQRADRLRKEQAAFLNGFRPEARAILEAILDKYTEYGPTEIVIPDILRLSPIAERGNVIEIARWFDGTPKLREAVEELQTLLYAA